MSEIKLELIMTYQFKALLFTAKLEMGSSSRKKKDKGHEKVYVQDSESDDDGVDIGFFDFSEETFKPTLNSCDDPFLNLFVMKAC
ncbi:hypothetical protein LXL04_002080 [Taraxacum kok-saghyz]